MNTKIFHTVNMGLYLCNEKASVLIDGIHGGKKLGFSEMPDVLVHQMEEQKGIFSRLDNLLFTHLHEDHYDRGKVSSYMQKNNPVIYACDLETANADCVPICDGADAVRMKNIDLLSLHTVHDGEIYKNDPHRSYLLRIGDDIFFVAGDAILNESDAELLMRYAGKVVSGAFLNPYQIVSKEGQSFIRNLSPERVFMIHLPLKEDDVYHILSIGKSALRAYPADLPPVEIFPHMSWLDGDSPEWFSANDLHII